MLHKNVPAMQCASSVKKQAALANREKNMNCRRGIERSMEGP